MSIRTKVRSALVAGLVAVGLLVTAVPANAHHGDWHQLQLVSLTCALLNDPSGDDEPYIKLNGGKIWENPDCYPIHTYDLRSAIAPQWFIGSVTIEVMEEDPWNPDDFIGRVDISESLAGAGVQNQTWFALTAAGYLINYQMEYEVF